MLTYTLSSWSRLSQEETLQALLDLLAQRGQTAYHGEAVSQTEHALQAAWAAEKAGAASALIAAALLHDVGHLLHSLPEDCAEQGIDDAHEQRGVRWLSAHFGHDVTEPIRLHVDAKRYLCATDSTYLECLSDASRRSLRLQGGPFSAEEARERASLPYFLDAVTLRRWDDEAKVVGLACPDLAHFRPHLEAAMQP